MIINLHKLRLKKQKPKGMKNKRKQKERNHYLGDEVEIWSKGMVMVRKVLVAKDFSCVLNANLC